MNKQVKVRMSEELFNTTCAEVKAAGIAYDAVVGNLGAAAVELYHSSGNIAPVEKFTVAIATFGGVSHMQAMSWLRNMIPHESNMKANWRAGDAFWGKKQPSLVGKTRKWRRFLTNNPDFREWKKAAAKKMYDASSFQKSLQSVVSRLNTLVAEDGDFTGLLEANENLGDNIDAIIKAIKEVSTDIKNPPMQNEEHEVEGEVVEEMKVLEDQLMAA